MADYLETSADYKAMAPYWETVSDVLGGTRAMRANGRRYLPQFPNESDKNYDYRIKNAKFTNLFADISGDLASKPFAKEVGLIGDTVPEPLLRVVEDTDRQGNHLHAFAFATFSAALNYGIDWIMVDHTRLPDGATLADERRIGGGPYWVRVPAQSLLAVYSAQVDGVEQIVYARINETRIEWRDGEEVTVERVRVLVRDEVDGGYAPARFEVHERTGRSWELVDDGAISLGIIPLVPLILGDRKQGTWQVTPPLRDILDLQIELFQQETNLKLAKELTAFPMFTANGIAPPESDAPAPMGPSTILYAPMNDQGQHGQWGVLEIGAQSLDFLSREIDKLVAMMRELGRQPLVSGTSGMTQATALLAAQRASSSAQAWAGLLKDALEQAFVYTAQWLSLPDPEVFVHTDFAIELGADQAPEVLLSLRTQRAISEETLWAEMKRRGLLSPEFDPDRERELLLSELPSDDVGEETAALGV